MTSNGKQRKSTIENKFGGTSAIIPRNSNFTQNDNTNSSINGRKELHDNQSKVLKLLTKDNTLTATGLAGKTGLGERTIYRILSELQKTGYLERIGTRKSGYLKIL